MTSRRRLETHVKILIGLVIGIIAGFIVRSTVDPDLISHIVKNYTLPFGNIFLRMIFMIVVPLLFSALVLGVAEIGNPKQIGRIGLRSLAMTIVLSGIAVGLGLTAVNIVKPGVGIPEEATAKLRSVYEKGTDESKKAIENSKKTKPVVETISEIVPKNPLEEAVRALEGGLLPFMFFALVFGIAMACVEAEKTLPVRAFLEGVFAISQKVIDFAMAFAPYGVAALIFGTVANLGTDSIIAVGKYFTLVLVVLAIHQFVIYSLAIKFVAKRNPMEFFRSIRKVMLTAFATSSSNATLPTALQSSQEDLGLPRDISSFVLTVGATANQNGTALFEGITIIFLAQFFGVSLDLGQQLTVMGLAIVAGIGTAGVPGGAWPMIAIILGTLGVPPEAIAICIGIDRILDMSRTVLNVTGDITIAACVAAMEKRPMEAPAEG